MASRTRIAGMAVVLLAGVLAAGAASPAPAAATGRLTYPFPTVYGISCPSTELCVAVDKLGHANISTDPTAATPTWSGSAIGGYILDPLAVSCASPALCVVVDSTGRAAISTNPTAPTPMWSTALIGGGTITPGISCPSTSLCVAVDVRGNAESTTDPTTGTPTWHTSSVDPTAELRAVSCPSTSLCAAVDSRGDATMSTDPAATSPTWSAPTPIDSTQLSGISCPSSSLCVAVDAEGRTVRSTNPSAHTPAWSAPAPSGTGSLSGISCPTTTLCVAASRGQDVSPLISTDPAEPAPVWRVFPGFRHSEPSEAPASVSCASTSFCVVAYYEEGMISTNPLTQNPAWNGPAPMVGLRAGTASLHGPPTTSGPNLHFSLNCAAEWIEECRGTATITATQRLTAHGHTVTGVSASARRRHVLLGRLKFATGGNGKTYTFKVALNTTGRHLLAKFKRLPATLTITAAARELRVPPKTVTVAAVRVMFRTRAALRRKR